jgi:hypothetical protein
MGGDLALADHVRRLDPCNGRRGQTQSLEADYRSGDPLDEAMVLLRDVVQVLDLSDLDYSATAGEFQDHIHRPKPCKIGPALVDDNPLRHAMPADRALEEEPGRSHVAAIGKQEINGLAVAFDGPVAVGSFALYLGHPQFACHGLTELHGLRDQAVVSKKHWAPTASVEVGEVRHTETGAWGVSGRLAPTGICPECGAPSRQRHGWRRGRIEDFPA